MPTTPDPHFPVTLPVLTWGHPDAERSMLLLHGLTSNGGTWWRIASTFAAEGWLVTAPDLRGHGRAPRTLDYSLTSFRNDVLPLRPGGGGSWDLVAAHSFGGAVAVHAAAADPAWARALLLVDPALKFTEEWSARTSAGARGTIRRTDPGDFMTGDRPWHQEDAWQRVLSSRVMSDHVIETVLRANTPSEPAGLLHTIDTPVHIVGADPAVAPPVFSAEQAAALTGQRASVTFTVAEGTGHSIQRDDPERLEREIRALHDRLSRG